MKINKKNMIKSKAGISYFEILVLVIASFSFAYIVHQSDSVIKEARNEIEKTKENLGIKSSESLLAKLISAWLERSKLNIASAEGIALNCCPKLKNNASCMDILNSKCQEQCAVPCLPSKCEQTASCKLGCCYDSNEGLCSNSAPKQDCSKIWEEDKYCNIEECRLGCCVLGSQTEFVTEKRCEKLSGFYGLGLDFRQSIDTELECLMLSNSQDEGACVIEFENDAGEVERGCRFTSKVECLKLTGNSINFHKDYLCSNPELNTSCEKQKTSSCLEGKDEVYWIDSCNNRENVYSSDKTKSWNNGKVLKKEDSCNSGLANIESKSCGNCNRFLGSRCGKGNAEFGNYNCNSLNCKKAPDLVDAFGKILKTKDRKNGESWCVYDSEIGDGKDAPGSRHWKYYCLDGKIGIEPCADFRNGLCVESDIKTSNSKISQAACRPNRALMCASSDKDKCKKNEDCRILDMNFGKNYQFSVCAAKYPTGFSASQIADKICSQADFTCVKIKVKELSGWKCVSGCECDSPNFKKQMNEWCESLGDCGDKDSLLEAGKPEAGEKASPGNMREHLKAYYGWGASNAGNYEEDLEKEQEDYFTKNLGKVAGAFGIGVVANAAGLGAFAIGSGSMFALSSTFVAGTGILFSTFGSAAVGAAIGAAAGVVIGKMFGLQGEAITILAVSGAVVGGGLLVANTIVWIATGSGFCGPLAWLCFLILVIVLAIVAATLKAMGVGKVSKQTFTYKCEPWQASGGGKNCEKCTQDKLKPCSKYKCQSLGQACEFINEGTGKELCINNNPNDVSSPIISPWLGMISSGYKYSEINENSFKIIGENEECLTEFQSVIFGIANNEASQCKMDVLHTENYDKMEYYFGDSNLYEYNHTMAFNLPSLDSVLQGMKDELNASDFSKLNSVSANKLGNLTYFVRCKDKNGNFNLNEYMIRTCVKAGPDLTPPQIIKTSPETESWLAFNETKKEINIWINEPANCRHSKDDTSYELMNKTFSCKTDYEDVDLYGWKCYGNLSNLGKGENKIYIRCKDQPWLAETNTSRNSMQESFLLNLKQSESELKIIKIEPNGTITSGTEPATITLKAYTSGGSDGKEKCEYSFTGSDYIQFFDTYGREHTQVFSMMLRGEYKVYIECEDISGNTAFGMTGFNVEIDNKTPAVARAYNSNSLKIITDEDAECAYDFKTCNFIWENATKMTGILKEHETSIEKGKTYYIKCRDLWENMPDSCSIIVREV